VIDNNREIQELEQGKTYKYLGIEESEGIQHQQMKDRLKKEYNRRLRMVLKSELNARNKITATGALAVPVLRYSFGIINWRLEEIMLMKGDLKEETESEIVAAQDQAL
jgi:D-serine dehydratase